jgi:hypothetical protein
MLLAVTPMNESFTRLRPEGRGGGGLATGAALALVVAAVEGGEAVAAGGSATVLTVAVTTAVSLSSLPLGVAAAMRGSVTSRVDAISGRALFSLVRCCLCECGTVQGTVQVGRS